MENNAKYRKYKKDKRALRVRKHLKGTAVKPRLSVVKSNKHIFAQLIDDEKGVTIAAMGTMSKEMQGAKKSKESAKQIGTLLAKKAVEKQIKEVVFDRGPFKYHGIIAEVAGGAREQGLQF